MVLVIIGLIVGGVLVGKDMIDAASMQAQIQQISQFNAAARTFQVKYGYLPGDIPDPTASSLGFITRTTWMSGPCCGNGDGVISGFCNTGSGVNGTSQTGETTVFWRDLSTASLISGTFNRAANDNGGYPNCVTTATTTPSISAYLPLAKLGQGDYILVWSGGPSGISGGCNGGPGDGINYFGLGGVPSLNCWGPQVSVNGAVAAGITVQQAYAIDSKIDDGLPQTGGITATFAAGAGWAGTTNSSAVPYTTATPGSSSTCFDNGNAAGAPQRYSLTQTGNNLNCALSFKFQ